MTATLEVPLRSARLDRDLPRIVRRFRPDIEGLRAVAVTLVVLSHLGLGFPGGYVGVDVFLVISGFLITRQLLTERAATDRISIHRFYARRARRILPAASVVIVGTVLACWRWDSPLRVRTDAVDAVYSAISGVNWRLAVQGTDYFAAGQPPSPFQHYWSLAVEEQFYLVWPALLVVIALMAGRRFNRRTALVLTLLAIIAGSLAVSITTTAGSPSWAYFGTHTRAWELALGALIAVTVDVWTRMPPALASQMSWLGLALIALSGLVFDTSTVYPGVAVLMPVLGSALVITGGCPGWSRSAELVLRQRPMQFVGRTSYSWYLVHWPILTILPMALNHDLTLGQKWLMLVGSLGVAVVLSVVVERPIRTRRVLVARPLLGLTLGVLLITASVATAAMTIRSVAIPGAASAAAAPTVEAANALVVQRAVSAAVSVKRLPAHVSPSLTAASTDRPASTRCLVADSVSAAMPDSKCTFGDPTANRTMVVIGDSHANAWSPAIDQFARTNHWRFLLYAKAACPPGVYLNDINPLTNRLYTQCNTWRAAVFARIAASRPQIVLIASELRTLNIDPTGTVQAVQAFQKSGAKVIYLEDTPNPLSVGSVPDCLAKNSGDIQQCTLNRSSPSSRLEGMIQRRVEATAVSQVGAILVDPTSWFCTTTRCPAVINDIIVYADNSHPTATYTRWLSPVMSAALAKATG
ncbi:MAG: acyltransferase [Actinomycetota bacterium]|nr:acyltransferase [Actinomycetota bacterium]